MFHSDQAPPAKGFCPKPAWPSAIPKTSIRPHEGEMAKSDFLSMGEVVKPSKAVVDFKIACIVPWATSVYLPAT